MKGFKIVDRLGSMGEQCLFSVPYLGGKKRYTHTPQAESYVIS